MNKILIIGSGSRENALAWKLKQSPKVEKIFIAPGNPGTAALGENVDIAVNNIQALADFAVQNKIDLTVVGPEEPLSLGIVDAFEGKNLKIWGPTKAAAQIESSKTFAKELMQKAGVPTAKFETFSDFDQAVGYVKSQSFPVVIKASGLASGKGVTIAQNFEEAETALRRALVEKIFGEAGSVVVIEEFLVGMEFSTHAFSDGKTFKMLPTSQDHKRIFDGDKGPNTGGVGTIASLPWITQKDEEIISQTIFSPIFKTLKDEGVVFKGLLYPGLMMTPEGPKVIEFNCRFGGPECESYMRILKSDLFDILMACVDGTLDKINIEWENKYACCIILASGGYPGDYKKGLPITGVEEAEKLDDIVVFHAGTKQDGNRLLTNGGRVLGVTALADDLKSALDKAYAAVKLINFDGMHYRTDIGLKSLLNTK